MTGWIDNHCHLDGEVDAASVVQEARSHGVEAMVCVGVNVERSRACMEIASANESVWATVGVHPHDASGGTEGLAELLETGAAAGTVVAVGECGLDYHYDNSPRGQQREVFAAQVAIAGDVDLPLVIHTREAWDDTFDILDSVGVPRRTVFHCFTGGPAEAEAALEREAFLSISGIVTFGGADDLRDAVRGTPLASLMVETDSPYLTPAPHRGRANRPWFVRHVGERVAELKDVEVAEVASVTTANARGFYGLPVTEQG